MDSISTSYTFSNLRNRAHFLPPRPVDSTAYLTPPSWVSMARANPVHRSLHRPPRTSRAPRGPSLQTEHKALSACDTVSPQAKTYSHCSAAPPAAPLPTSRGNPRDPTLMANDPAASLLPPRRAAPRSTRAPPASDLHYLTPDPPARRRKHSPQAPDPTRRPIPAVPPAAAPPLAPLRPVHGTKRKQAPRTHEPPNLLPPLLKQATTACIRTPVGALSLYHLEKWCNAWTQPCSCCALGVLGPEAGVRAREKCSHRSRGCSSKPPRCGSALVICVSSFSNIAPEMASHRWHRSNA
jgi:hypothetical protein